LTVRDWTVAGALIPYTGGLVLVANRRRNGTVEWTPPGGVIDPGESVLEGLAREVREETGLEVAAWAGRRYTVRVDAPGLGWRMRVEAWEVAECSGDVVVADPDGIVELVQFADRVAAAELLASSPPWVQVPVAEWLDGARHAEFRFRLHGTTRDEMRVERTR
jgi:8-oxo-dGTP diphosphatase